MPDDIRFMNEVFRIVGGALRLDLDRVRNYTAFLADKLDKAGDHNSAGRLRKLLEQSDHTLRPAGSSVLALPVDSESRFPLVERVRPLTSEPGLVLSPGQWDLVREFLSVAKSHAQFEIEGLATSMSFLMYGPPGTGKSRLARYIAEELGLELYVARLDGVVSSYLGSTSKNIRGLFDFAASRPCVLFLDEFDAIAKMRGDTQELGELKRVVNSFIQNLDSLGRQTIILAATNHEELLDRAIWRRFTYRIELRYPTAKEREELWAEFLRPIPSSRRELSLIADISEGFSGSDIREAALRMHRQRVTSGKPSELSDIFSALLDLASGEGNERRVLSTLRSASPQLIVSILRKRNPKLYSHHALARILGVSKATAYRWSQSEEDRSG